MNQFDHQSKIIPIKKRKKLFLSHKKQSSFICGECSIFNNEQILVDYKEIQLSEKYKQNFQQDYNNKSKISNNLQNSGKKSLKSQHRNSKYLISTGYGLYNNKVSQKQRIPFLTKQPIKSIQNQLISTHYRLNQINNSLNQNKANQFSLSTSLNPSIFISRDASGTLKPPSQLYQGLKPRVMQLNNKKSIGEQPFIKIPMIQSIRHQHIRNLSERQKLLWSTVTSNQNSSINRIPIQQKYNDHKTSYPPFDYNRINNPTSKQNLTYLGISPVKNMSVLQEQSSGMNSYNITQRENQFQTEKINSPPVLNKQTSQDYSVNSKFNLKKPINQSNSIILVKQQQHQNPQFFQSSAQHHEYLNSINLLTNLHNFYQQKSNQQNFQNRFIVSEKNKIKQNHQLESLTNSIHGQNNSILRSPDQIQQRQKMLQQQMLIKAIQAKNKGQKQFGRHSAELPKLKKLITFNVRKTISMRDQQSSSEDQTSEVIYGFRKLNDLQIMEDIQEDMQQSMMTKIQRNNGNNTSSFHKF